MHLNLHIFIMNFNEKSLKKYQKVYEILKMLQ